jgi:hypothetical protein
MDWLLLGRHMLLSLLIVVVMLFALPMAQAWAAEQAWTVHRTADGFQLASDALTLEIDTERATLRSVVVGDRSIVWANTQPLLQASLIESQRYDQRTDYMPDGRDLAGTFVPGHVEYAIDGEKAVVLIKGALRFSGDDALDFQLRLVGRAGEQALQAEVCLDARGPFTNRFVRDVSFRLPLALNHRKRIAQGGDQGFTWDTRYFHQFHLNTTMGPLAEPDTNEWRLFSVDQRTPVAYQIWRAESETTAPLVMQQGAQAAGWTSIYDEQGGMLFAYRDLARLAPKALRVQAWDRGAALVMLHPDSSRAISPYGPQAAQVLGVTHSIDLLFFTGTYGSAQPTAQLASRWGETSLVSDPPIRIEPKFMVGHDAWLPKQMSSGDLAPWITGGVALPRGQVRDPYGLQLFRGVQALRYQAEPIAFWPDGSIKWLLMSFLDNAGSGAMPDAIANDGRIPLAVTLRDGTERAFSLRYADAPQKPASAGILRIEEHADGLAIDTGPLQVDLQLGSQWIKRIALNGETIAAAQPGDTRPTAFVDFFRVDEPYVTQTTHPSGQEDPGPVVIDQIAVETAGAYRTVIRLEGHAQSREQARVIIRLELYAQRAFMRMTHTVEYLHQDPREVFVRQMGIRLPTALDTYSQTVTVGGEKEPIQLRGWQEAGLCQSGHMEYTIWQQDGDKLDEVEHLHRAAGWIDVSDGQRGVLLAMRDMWQEAPNELVASRDDGTLTAYFWPASMPLMDVRRYSDLPHLSQGESVRDRNDWVETSYYGRDPFVGVSKTQEVLWFFHEEGVESQQLGAVAADFQSPPLIYMGEAWYREHGFLLPQADPALLPQATQNRDLVADFWLYHQRLFGWYGKWHYGDIQHQFNSGYGSIALPQTLSEVLALPQVERQAFTFGSAQRQLDYAPQHHWAMDNGRWGWGNTEGLPGLFFQREYLRTGDREQYFMAEALARHARDVIIRQSGRWFGQGTRHGVQPWSDGNHEERQTVHSEFRFHYFLSGDPRSREVAQKLLEQHYLKKNVSVHAAHSGRLYGLLTNWEMSGDPELGEILRQYVHTFIVPEGIAASPPVAFSPQVALMGPPQDTNSTSMFFHVFGATHALIEYYYLTHDEELRQALVKMAAALMPTLPHRSTSANPSWLVVAFAAKHADDPKPYQSCLRNAFEGEAWQYAVRMVNGDSSHWSGPTAAIRGGVPSCHFWMNALPYAVSALPDDFVPSQAQLEQVEQLDADVRRRSEPAVSWQSEYDDPEFDAYLGPWRPWTIPLRVRFAGELRENARLRGKVPLGIRVVTEAPEDFVEIKITLDGEEILASGDLDAAEGYVLDTLALTDDLHELTVTVVDRAQGLITRGISFRVRNWWSLVDELKAPIMAFGFSLDLLRVEDKSDGWEYVDDHPELFFGDTQRLTRATSTDEYLVWSTPLLQECEVTLYAQLMELAGGVVLAVSEDGTHWQDVSYETQVVGTSSEGWQQVRLRFIPPADVATHWLRLTFTEALAPEVQLGEVAMKGLLAE